MSRLGAAGPGEARLGKGKEFAWYLIRPRGHELRHGKPWFGSAWQGKVRRGKEPMKYLTRLHWHESRLGTVELGKARYGKARRGPVRQGVL